MVTAEDYPTTLKLTNRNNPAAVPITCLWPDDANVVLGFRMAPSGSQNLEVAYRTKQSNQLTARLNTTTLTATEAWVL